MPDFSRPSPVDGHYDVFLSFRGQDTRKRFTTNLYYALRQHEIHTFMDEELTGEEIIKCLFLVIEQSRMAVVVYSKGFASSHYCLWELVTILQRKKEQKMMVIPIFYNVDPHEVKHCTGKTGVYLNNHVAKHGKETVENWKAAVTSLCKLSGLIYNENDSWSEHDFIESVIDKIKKKRVDQCSMEVEYPVISHCASSSNQGKPEGMVADKQFFTYGEILKITNNLQRFIARGGLGDVYHGKLNGVAVAVKIFPQFLVEKLMEDGLDGVEAHLRNLLSYRHKNLVSLVGYCCDAENVALIYEFMENGSLRMHLSEARARVLTWKERMKIARDIAEGLNYLHRINQVTYGNLQITDILFNEKMTVKILYFPCLRKHRVELADLSSRYDRYITSLIATGESFLFNTLFYKNVDLHILAMILYELLTGHPPPLTTWQNFVMKLSQRNLTVDSRLVGVFNKISIKEVIKCAFTCAQMVNVMEDLISDVLREPHTWLVGRKEWIMGSK